MENGTRRTPACFHIVLLDDRGNPLVSLPAGVKLEVSVLSPKDVVAFAKGTPERHAVQHTEKVCA